MCKGTSREKAPILFDTIQIGSSNKLEICENLDSNKRLYKAFKKMVWFSEIFPKKFEHEFIDQSDLSKKDIKIDS